MNLAELDKSHLWHPFTQFEVWRDENPLIVERAEDYFYFATDGKRYLDGVSSIWCNMHGHSNLIMKKALSDQSEKLVHSTLLGLSHEPSVKLAHQLLGILPTNLSRVFFADSGSNAVEAAIRMAVESASEGRTKLGSLNSAYHGDTLGAVGVGYLESFHKKLSNVTIQAERVSPPIVYELYKGHSKEEAESLAIKELEEFFFETGRALAAFIIEPLVQGAAGIWVHSKTYLQKVRELCSQYQVMMICDEVATGFCKTGSYFACQEADVTPDFLVMGKGLSGGLLPISAVATTENVFESFRGKPSEMKTFFYGQTFAGNPLAAALSLANLSIITEPSYMAGLRTRIKYFNNLVQSVLGDLDCIFEIRQQGLMTGLELTRVAGKLVPFDADQLFGAKVTYAARELGLIIRPLGNVMVLMPAPSMPENLLEEVVIKTEKALASEFRKVFIK